eukprot:1699571-Alexandrium_andersonii.AAC.1
MSASLVGSEMCIRDRPRSASMLSGRLPNTYKARSKERKYVNAYNDIEEAVSYTHLTLPTICSV